MISVGEGVDKLGTEEPDQKIREIAEAYPAMVNHGIDCDDCKKMHELPERDDLAPADRRAQDDQDLADRKIGFEAGLDGQGFDDSKNRALQRGWADAQE